MATLETRNGRFSAGFKAILVLQQPVRPGFDLENGGCK
jgi:hypothetical protein